MPAPMSELEKATAGPVLEYAAPGRASLWRRVTGFREFMILGIIVIASIGMSFASDVFLSRGNILAMLLGVSIESIVAIGMTILMVSGGFDMSVGSTVALTGAVSAYAMLEGVPVPLAIGMGLAAGAAIGVINGVVIAKVGINPFITTLGMMGVVRGVLEVVTRGQNIAGLPASFKAIGQGDLLGI
ncbi:MAG TPA: ABC transporter permease [Tepidisphaeraceae bacterium]|nr:ABC transporter permease [Tepidisphaeraceae bacterium]